MTHQPMTAAVCSQLARPLSGSNDTNWHADFTLGTLPSNITFSRASGASVWNASGLLAEVGTDLARFDHEPVSRTPRGLLLEGSRTNLVLHSADWTQTTWQKTDATVTGNSCTAPDGTNTLNAVTEGTAGTALVRSFSVTIPSGATVTASCFVKRGNTDWLRVVGASASPPVNGGQVWVNLSTGALGTVNALGTGTGISAAITPCGNGFYRVAITYTVPSITTALLYLQSASADGSTTRVNNATYGVWGGQIGPAPFASSYIPTTTATATRAAGLPMVTDLNSIGFNPLAGTMVLRMRHDYIPIAPRFEHFLSLYSSVSGSGNSLRLYKRHTTGAIRAEVWNGGINQALLEFGAIHGIITMALSYEPNNVWLSVNGQTAIADTSVTLPTGLDRLHIGGRGGISGDTESVEQMWLERLTYWPTATNPATLQSWSV
jgi:hypothetical protein